MCRNSLLPQLCICQSCQVLYVPGALCFLTLLLQWIFRKWPLQGLIPVSHVAERKPFATPESEKCLVKSEWSLFVWAGAADTCCQRSVILTDVFIWTHDTFHTCPRNLVDAPLSIASGHTNRCDSNQAFESLFDWTNIIFSLRAVTSLSLANRLWRCYMCRHENLRPLRQDEQEAKVGRENVLSLWKPPPKDQWCFYLLVFTPRAFWSVIIQSKVYKLTITSFLTHTQTRTHTSYISMLILACWCLGVLCTHLHLRTLFGSVLQTSKQVEAWVAGQLTFLKI